MEDIIGFATWCMDTEYYVYDSTIGWFHRKTMKKYTWEEIYEIYVKQIKK